MDEYFYNPSHLYLCCSTRTTTTNTGGQIDTHGHLSTLLGAKWNTLMTSGHFRYTLPQPLPTTKLPGPYSFILQLNPHRGVERRRPQTIHTLSQPFDLTAFNFNLVSPPEILFNLRPWWEETPTNKHSLLINVSPLEWGHILLTPFRTQNRPQRLSPDGLRIAIELAILLRSGGGSSGGDLDLDWRVGFNSLCGYASVNHEHYHAYTLRHRLYLETAKLIPLSTRGSSFDLFELQDYPAPALVWVLDDIAKVENLVQQVMAVANHLQATNTAHNLFMTPTPIACHEGTTTPSTIRIFLWARVSSYGAKESDGFNPALCELGGHFPCKNEETYLSLNEEKLVKVLRELTAKPWANLRKALIEGTLTDAFS